MLLESKTVEPGLKNIVHAFVNFETSSSERDFIKVYPNGYSYFTYSYKNKGYLLEGSERYYLPRFFISGQSTHDKIEINVEKEIGHFGIEFSPTGFYKLFGFNMLSIQDYFTPCDFMEIQDPDYFNAMRDSSSFNERCILSSKYLLSKLPSAFDTRRVDQCVKLIDHNPTISIKEASHEVGISERQMRRDFKEVVGLQPKTYAKVKQIKAVYRMIKNESNGLKDFAYSCGYYDIAHFIHSFKNYVGENPTEFLTSYDDYLAFYLSEKRT